MKPCNLSGIKYPENTNCHVSLQAAAKIRNNRESFIKKSKIITTTPHNSATLIGNLQNETISTPHLSENKRPPKAPLIATSLALIICDDILNAPRGYPQQPARISSTAREDILNSPRRYPRPDAVPHSATNTRNNASSSETEDNHIPPYKRTHPSFCELEVITSETSEKLRMLLQVFEAEEGFEVVVVGIDDAGIDFGTGWMVTGGV